jgi:hypothetical protein
VSNWDPVRDVYHVGWGAAPYGFVEKIEVTGEALESWLRYTAQHERTGDKK